MIKDYFKNFYNIYGALGIAAAIAVFGKMALFYYFIGVSVNFIPVLFVSLILIYLLFASFKNKLIPAVIFSVMSVIMLADVTYAAFFNRYLSVNMMAAAVFIKDITASIIEVFRPEFILLLADVCLIFTCLIIKRKIPVFLSSFKKKIITAAAAILLIILLIANVTGSNLVKSVSNQEIITYHIKDIVHKAFGITEETGLSVFKDTYALEKEGPHFGIAKGRNLIVIQLEAFQNFVVGLTYNGQEITPNLNRLIAGNTAYFDNYYQQIGSGNTSDAEFAINNSIHGSLMSYTYKLYGGQNYFRGLPVLLKERGYDTAVFHAHESKDFWSRETAYPGMGFDRYYGGLTDREGDGVYEMKEWMGWGLTDTHFYAQTIPLMETLKEPFYSFVISLSNHHPYKMLEHYQFIEFLPEDEGTYVGNYLSSASYTDYALGQFLDGLKEKGWYDNSVIAVFGDHFGLEINKENSASIQRLLGRPYGYADLMNVPLIISVPGAADIKQTISTAGGHLDFFPTIAYLLGFEKLDTLYLGHNLFTVKEGFVAQLTHMTKGSYFKNDMAFLMSRDGVFENGRAWNLLTGEPVPLCECYDDYSRSMSILNTSEYILRSDAIRRIFLLGEEESAAFSVDVKRPYPGVIACAGAPGAPGNSVEDIKRSHHHDHRYIRVELFWTDDSEEPLPYAKDAAGNVVMTHEELLAWMESHGGTLIIAGIERSGDYFMKIMAKENPAAAERFILELTELYEYTGKHEGIINLTGVSQSAAEIRDFVEKNNVWAIMMTKEDAEGRFAGLMDVDAGVYIIGETDGLITRAN